MNKNINENNGLRGLPDFFKRYQNAEYNRVLGVDQVMANWLNDNGYKSDTAGKKTKNPKSWYKITPGEDDTSYVAIISSKSATPWGGGGAPYEAKLWKMSQHKDSKQLMQEFDIPKFNKQLLSEIEHVFTSLVDEDRRGTSSLTDFNF